MEKFQSDITGVTDEDHSGRQTISRRAGDVAGHQLWVSDITKFVQGACQSSMQISTNEHAWKRDCNFCSNIVKERLSCKGLSQAMEHACTTMKTEANIKAWSGSTLHHPRPRNSKVYLLPGK
jgi:hypothetical protein